MAGNDEDARAARLAVALRENLKRRKTQARGRNDVPRTYTVEEVAPAKIRQEGEAPSISLPEE